MFLTTLKDCPTAIDEMRTIIKIPQINCRQSPQGTNMLLDRSTGFFLFRIDRDGVSFYPYFSTPNVEYKEEPGDRESIANLTNHFINEIPLGPMPLGAIKQANLIFTFYGIVTGVEHFSNYSMLLLKDSSTKQLQVKLWERAPESLPKRGDFIKIERVRSKEVQDLFVTAEVSRSAPLDWTLSNCPQIKKFIDLHAVEYQLALVRLVFSKALEVIKTLPTPLLQAWKSWSLEKSALCSPKKPTPSTWRCNACPSTATT